MKLYIASDTHSVNPMDYRLPPDHIDVAILAGDIHTFPKQAVEWMTRGFGPDVDCVYVLGNHEFYHGVLEDRAAEARESCRGTSVHLLDADQVFVKDDVRFLGCTLWTDYEFGSPDRDADDGMAGGFWINDWRRIETSDGAEIPKPFDPKFALQRHWRERRWLEARLDEEFDGHTVVVTHHAPHPNSLHPRHADDKNFTNASFISDLTDIIERFQPTLWVHGHVHDSFDYNVGSTRVICNPRGMPEERNTSQNMAFDPNLIIELPEWTPKPRMGM